MSASSQKKRKQQQRRNRKRRQSARRQGRKTSAAGNSAVEEPPLDELESLNDFDEPEPWDEPDDVDDWLNAPNKDDAPPPELSERAEVALRIWWDKYADADGPTRLQMTREKLETISADDDRYQHFFPEAVSELQCKLSRDQYVAFLEELGEARRASDRRGDETLRRFFEGTRTREAGQLAKVSVGMRCPVAGAATGPQR